MLDESEIDKWLFGLMLKREVLEEFEKAIRELIKMCKSVEEFDIIVHTVENLIVLNSNQLGRQLNLMAVHIKTVVDDGSPLAIVATAWDHQPDSSQILVQLLKPKFRSMDHVQFFTSVPAFEKKKFMQEYPKFVLVDEFSGTGKTIETRLKHIEHHAKGKGIAISPHVCLMFGMENAFDHISNFLSDTHFCNRIKAGISGYFTGAELTKRVANMKRLEEELAADVDGKPMPSLGKGEAEALYFIKDHNAPNSNFPIFWWPKDSKNCDRLTMMERAEL